ncbi:MAG: YqgE/AlgH family protein [Proteobacteria bacterium]|jgi:putative transcriptional regulator|nr:YqgE/AlgH family protein [Pseudomonadota bacterium]
MAQDNSFTGHFLIAMPNLADPNFFHTVTYLCEYSPAGAMGLVINRPLDLSLGELAEQLDIEVTEPPMANVPIYQGGPVQTDRGFVLHTPQGEWDNTLSITPDIALTVSQDILESIAQGVGPEHFLITLGYAGWGEGQLEEELAANAWLNGPADTRIIFSTPVESRWPAAAAHLGIDLGQLSSDIGHA